MTAHAALFYVLAAVVLAATLLAVTRRNLVHAVVYLVISFLGSAVLFYLLGAPLPAALEVIVYAGAIMVLFLFIVMMLRADDPRRRLFAPRQLLPAAVLALVCLASGILMESADESSRAALAPAMADPAHLGRHLFTRHWLAVEIVSLLLLVALVGALHLGQASRRTAAGEGEGEPP